MSEQKKRKKKAPARSKGLTGFFKDLKSPLAILLGIAIGSFVGRTLNKTLNLAGLGNVQGINLKQFITPTALVIGGGILNRSVSDQMLKNIGVGMAISGVGTAVNSIFKMNLLAGVPEMDGMSGFGEAPAPLPSAEDLLKQLDEAQLNQDMQGVNTMQTETFFEGINQMQDASLDLGRVYETSETELNQDFTVS